MKVLAVDTALGACSVAIIEDARMLAHHWIAMSRGHAEALAPMVKDAMGEAELEFAALDRLAVTTGPGTFTGQRVGLAFMRGLRLALKRPLLGITTLEAMAAAAAAETGRSLIAVLHEAKRGELYGALFEGDKAIIPVQVAEFAAMLTAIERSADSASLALAGTAAEAAQDWFQRRGMLVGLTAVRQPDALWVARLALHTPPPGAAPRPLYLRPPDAKLPASAAPKVVLRSAERRDSGLLSALHTVCFAEGWSAQAFEDLLAGPGVFACLAEMKGQPVGFALGRTAADEAELLSIGVLEAHRRAGIGRLLLEALALGAAERGAASLFLEVAQKNIVARGLYNRLGFNAVGSRKGYYGEEDALVLRAALPLGKSPESRLESEKR